MHPEVRKWMIRRVVVMGLAVTGGTCAISLMVVLGDMEQLGSLPPWATWIPPNLVGLLLGLLSILSGALVERFWNMPLRERLRQELKLPRGTSHRGQVVGILGGILLLIGCVSVLVVAFPLDPLPAPVDLTAWDYAKRLVPLLWVEAACLVFVFAWVVGGYLIGQLWPEEQWPVGMDARDEAPRGG